TAQLVIAGREAAQPVAAEPGVESNVRISLRAEEVTRIGNFPITNSLVLSTLVMLGLATVAIALNRKLKMIPGAIQNLFEIFLEQILDLMDTVFGDRARSEKYLPLAGTIFLFVLFSNWLGLLPGVGSIIVRLPHETAPLLRSPSADLNFTLALAIITVISVNVLGAFAIGAGSHASKFFNFKNPVAFFIGILELVSEGARMVSFSFRLFGNVFAGEVLLTIIGFLLPYAAPIPFLFLEVFVGFIQALIFTMLAVVFISIAITPHEHEEGNGHQKVTI
ncbi:MAG: F0F1 ATP synthase subunit A, partial [Candidatus Liptonbacteria bacterium]